MIWYVSKNPYCRLLRWIIKLITLYAVTRHTQSDYNWINKIVSRPIFEFVLVQKLFCFYFVVLYGRLLDFIFILQQILLLCLFCYLYLLNLFKFLEVIFDTCYRIFLFYLFVSLLLIYNLKILANIRFCISWLHFPTCDTCLVLMALIR